MSKRLTMLLLVVCGLLVVADAAYHKHAHFATDALFGFYAFFGLLASVALVVVARVVGALLRRREDYYGE